MDEQARKKELAAKAAVDYVIENEYLGVGTGTTVSFFIAALQQSGKKVKACVSSSDATTSPRNSLFSKRATGVL